MAVSRALLFPTPLDRMTDARGRPYFLWDLEDMDVEAFRSRLSSPDGTVRAYWIAKLMRQAKPDDVFSFVTVEEIARLWAGIEPHLGKERAFWIWLFGQWQVHLDR